MAADEGGGSQPFLRGSFVWDKTGPLPNWAWMGLVLGALLGFSVWRKNKSSSPNPDPNASIEDVGMRVPGDQTAPFVFKTDFGPFNIHNPPSAVNITVPAAPPGGGRPDVPPAAPDSPAPVGPTNWIAEVQKWPDQRSTLSGLAAYYAKPGGKPKPDGAALIYNANKDVIEAQAKAHGNSSSNNGNLLYQGMKLRIPWLDSSGRHLF